MFLFGSPAHRSCFFGVFVSLSLSLLTLSLSLLRARAKVFLLSPPFSFKCRRTKTNSKLHPELGFNFIMNKLTVG